MGKGSGETGKEDSGTAPAWTEVLSRIAFRGKEEKSSASRTGVCKALGPQETSSWQNWGARGEPN